MSQNCTLLKFDKRFEALSEKFQRLVATKNLQGFRGLWGFLFFLRAAYKFFQTLFLILYTASVITLRKVFLKEIRYLILVENFESAWFFATAFPLCSWSRRNLLIRHISDLKLQGWSRRVFIDFLWLRNFPRWFIWTIVCSDTHYNFRKELYNQRPLIVFLINVLREISQ